MNTPEEFLKCLKEGLLNSKKPPRIENELRLVLTVNGAEIVFHSFYYYGAGQWFYDDTTGG